MKIKLDYKEIFNAWVTSIKPTNVQKELAKKRLDICTSCSFRKEVIEKNKWSAYCGDCGCPLNKKVFSNIYNSCTQKKWEKVDSEFLNILETKNSKTII